MIKTKFKAIVVFIALTVAGGFGVSATAQSPDGEPGPSIEGDTEISVSAEDITTMADQESIANTRIGSITGDTTIQGDTTISVEAEGITTVAEDGSLANANIGTINNANITGNTEISVTATDVTTVAESGSCADTQIGSISDNAC